MLGVLFRHLRRAPLLAILVTLVPACEADGTRNGATIHEESGVVGPAGGIVRGPGGLILSIPEGALAHDTSVTITLSRAGEAPSLPPDLKPVGDFYSVLPHGLTFAKPAMITVPFEQDTAALMLMSAEPGRRWSVVPGATVEGRTLTALVSSLSFFVATRPAPRV